MRFCLLLSAIILAGCSSVADVPKEQAYDIDVVCDNRVGNAFEICDPLQREECNDQMERYDCYNPTFHIKCDKQTMQIVDGIHYCTTHDGKSVRVTLETYVPTDEDFNRMFLDTEQN